MAKTPSLIETLQNDLKAKFDENMAGLAKLPFSVLINIAKAQRLNVVERKYFNPPFDVRNGGTKVSAENKKLFVKWLNSIPNGAEFSYNWVFSMDVPLFTKASEVYTLIHHDISERILRATAGKNKDLIGLMINFNFAVEDAIKVTSEKYFKKEVS